MASVVVVGRSGCPGTVLVGKESSVIASTARQSPGTLEITFLGKYPSIHQGRIQKAWPKSRHRHGVLLAVSDPF